MTEIPGYDLLRPMPRWRVAVAVLVACVAVCGASQAGKPTAGDYRNAQAYLDAHNAVRAGVKKPAKYAGAWEPLPPVVWSDEIALSSQAWAEHLRDSNACKLVHSDTRYGENLAGGKDMDAAQAVELWASEGRKFNWLPQYDFVMTTGHYSQLVWRKTARIGCGRATCRGRAAIVCRYDPPGNHIGRAPY